MVVGVDLADVVVAVVVLVVIDALLAEKAKMTQQNRTSFMNNPLGTFYKSYLHLGALCFEQGFTQTLPGNQHIAVK